jgi:predicted peptidase
MKAKSRLSFLLATLLCLSLLVACAAPNRFGELRYDEPSRYYLHIPANYDEARRWSLFIALHDQGEDAGDCIQDWFEIADQQELFLLCPEFEGKEDGFDSPENERILADVLSSLYQEFALNSRFFVVGRGEAASFALNYAYRYPQAIAGVSAIDPVDYPQRIGQVEFPILFIVKRGDQPAMEAANAFDASLSGSGAQTRILEIDGLGNNLPYRAQRLSVEFFEQLPD